MKQGSAFPEKQRLKSGKEALPVWGLKINSLQRSRNLGTKTRKLTCALLMQGEKVWQRMDYLK